MPDVNLAYQTIFKLVGKQGKCVLEKKQFLDSVAKVDKDLAKSIEKSVEGVTNPTFELSGKATANYNIAGLKIRNGNQEVIGTGAMSKAQENVLDEDIVLKGRFDLPNGNIIRINNESFDDVLNVYKGKKNTPIRECSLYDASYREPIRTFDKAGEIREYKAFDANENKMTKVYKYGDTVIGDMKITEGKKGVVKLEMKETPLSHPMVEFYDTEGNMIAGSRFFNGGKFKVEKIRQNGTDYFTKTTYFRDGQPDHFEYECFGNVPDDAARAITSCIDKKTGKELITGFTRGDGSSPVLYERDLAIINNSDSMRKALETYSTTYDNYIAYLMK